MPRGHRLHREPERLSRILDKRGIKHNVLNAKNHEREAQIVAQAGREGAVTIATNMAGRGTDILLGGNPDELAEEAVLELDFGIEQATVVACSPRATPRGDLEGSPSRASMSTRTRSPPSHASTPLRSRGRREGCEVEKRHVIDAGGLCVIGTERHESRRIDNQLRGRSGRQGDRRDAVLPLA